MKTIAMVVVMVALAACEDASPIATPAPAKPTIEQLARAFAMEKITPTLLAPATADYPLATIKSEPMPPLEDSRGRLVERVCVRGGVDAHNSHGAFIRNEWKVIMLRDGESFKPVEASLKKELVYIDAGYDFELVAAESRRVKSEDELRAERERLAAIDAVNARREKAIAETRRMQQELVDIQARATQIPGEIEQHEQALKALPARPAGGTAFAEVEKHRNAIDRLKFEAVQIEARVKELKRLALTSPN